MADELAEAAVAAYTKGRLAAGDNETARLLAEGLAAARRYCGWHVTPVKTETITLDGPGGRLLRLPTLRLVELVQVVENGDVEYVAADLYVSPLGLVSKRSGGNWSNKYGAIQVTLEHGFDAAPDFDAAVLSAIDRASLAPTGGQLRAVGPFQYELSGSADERARLDLYRLERPA